MTSRNRPLPYPRKSARRLLARARRRARRIDALSMPRWVGALAVGATVGFVPWIVYLGFTLPAKVRAQHYDIAWLGFDCAMWTLLAVLAWAVLRRHAATGPVAAMASTMLVVDAWFDIFTSSAQHGEMILAIVLALCGELPLAILCGWIAVHAERIRTRTYRSLQQRWERAVRRADESLTPPRVAPRPR